jgi:YaiO family outer membrane protein
MTMPTRKRRAILMLVLGLRLATIRLHAQDNLPTSEPAQASTNLVTPIPTEPSNPKELTNYAEAGGSYLPLSNNFGHLSNGYARASITSRKNVWFAEVNRQHEFGDAGTYVGGSDTYTFSPDWYGSLNLGSSIGGFFWPRFRGDAFINRKWLNSKRLITTFGFAYFASKDVHRDHNFYIGSTYYFDKPWIVETGLHYNVSNPGSVSSPSAFVAATQGRNKHHYITVRVGFGEEAYQLVGPTASLSDFSSQTLTVTWRQWIGKNWGLNAVGDYYHNPFYSRGGNILGVFKEF